ncbi:hypothetical protein JR316_0006250 [Psilocybe cubensis]|uniref:Uncharacterized protein n=2 Tax=Psilocybe cubensis TaxID=181762 RepID=A0ACB8H1R7_PSICU|nr:hypothetical protein JR316_0006250 [Psilocybe cubensis]KAH9481723.1 hypothetical protein JR316_0006250 [Psilocybe cubensis]
MKQPLSPSYISRSSAMSELDSLSDSDWLDIASGRDSDDNDSLSDQDSDRDEISSMPRSRRSSISNGDSVSSDVEAWEGFVSDGGDEAEAITGMYTVPLPSALGAQPLVLGFDPIVPIVDEAIAAEDRRVREALDQSFVGTLSASARAATGSAHTSIRDLRLSFPDPITSSRDELHRSYETVSSPTETTLTSTTDNDDIVPGTEPESSHMPSELPAPPPIEDPGLPSTTPAVQHHEVQPLETAEETKAQAELEIVLYGASSEVKCKFVQELIHSATTASGYTPVDKLREGEHIQTLRFTKSSDNISKFFNAIDISDRTNNIVGVDNVDRFDCPSLAVVYLPTVKLPVLAWHDAYLPVVIPTPDSELDDAVMLQNAEDDWDLLAIPSNRVVKLGTSKSSIFNPKDLVQLSSVQILQILRGIGRDTKKITALKPLTEQVKSVNAVTLFALMSIIMGFAFNTAFRSPTPSPTPTVNTPSGGTSHASQLWGLFATQPNKSILASSMGTTPASTPGLGVGSLKDMALSVFNPGSTSLSVTPPLTSKSLSVASVASKEVSHTNGHTKAVSATKCQQCPADTSSSKAGVDKARVFTDVAVKSTATALSKVSYMTPAVSSHAQVNDASTASGSGSGTSVERLTVLPTSGSSTGAEQPLGVSMNVNLNAVSSALDATTKALVSSLSNVNAGVNPDSISDRLSSTLSAADTLLSNLRAQTDVVIRSSKGKARALSTHLVSLPERVDRRNRRARRRAKQLREKGEKMVKGVSETVRERTERARRRARELGGAVVGVGADVWGSYERAQGDWEGVLSNARVATKRNNGQAKRTNEGADKDNKVRRWEGRDKENIRPPAETRNCWKDKLSIRRQMRRGLDYL